MNSLSGRVSKLEEQAAQRSPEKPWLIATQDHDDPNLYHVSEGDRTYSRSELLDLDKYFRVLRIDQSHDYLEPHADDGTI